MKRTCEAVPFAVGCPVGFRGWEHEPNQRGVVVERTNKPVTTIERRGNVTHYYGSRVEWPDGQVAWVSNADLVAL